MTKAYALRRHDRDRLRALWKPEYDVLATYNHDRYRGLEHTPEHVAWMAEVQRDYNENYLPAADEIWRTGKTRRVWFVSRRHRL